MKHLSNLATGTIDVKALGKVAVLMGGHSSERDISLLSGHGVLTALRARGVDAHAFDPSQRGLHGLKTDGFSRCFVALHGRMGEDGSVQGALELLGVPYTGSGVMASAIAMDKVMTKRVWSTDGLPMPEHVVIHESEALAQALPRVQGTLGLPLIVKPPHEGSSIGVTRVSHAAQLEAAVLLARRHDKDVLCERLIVGPEVTCPVVGQGARAQALPVVVIAAPEGDYDYQNKYFTDTVRYTVPSGLPSDEEARIQGLAVAAYRSLGCRGWGRADFMIDAVSRKPYLLEMNTAPGMTSHSLVPMSAKAAGLGYEDLCLLLIAEAALDQGALKPSAPSSGVQA
jgi:D-alanine-D-alanine ligase